MAIRDSGILSETSFNFSNAPLAHDSSCGTIVEEADKPQTQASFSLASLFVLPDCLRRMAARSQHWVFPFNAHHLLMAPPATQKDPFRYERQVAAVSTRRRAVVCCVVACLALRFCSFDLFCFLLVGVALLILYLAADPCDRDGLDEPQFDDTSSMLSSLSFKTDPQLFHHANSTQFTLQDDLSARSLRTSVSLHNMIAPTPRRTSTTQARRNREAFV